MRAVVVCFNSTARLTCIRVKGIQVGTDTLDRLEVLCYASSSLQDFIHERLGLAFDIVGHWYSVHVGVAVATHLNIGGGSREKRKSTSFV